MDNIEIKEGSARIKVNPRLYPLEAIYSAAYVFMDNAYVLLEGSPDSEIFVVLKPKNEEDPIDLGSEFNNELMIFSEHLSRAKRTIRLREMYLQRAIITNKPELVKNENKTEQRAL